MLEQVLYHILMDFLQTRWRWISALGISLALVWIVYTSLLFPLPAAQGTISAPREGFQAPDFTLSALDGSSITLSDMAGKVVFINFWATWCPPCEAEMPAIQSLHESSPEVIILAVNATNQDSLEEVRRFVTERQLTFPILLDQDGQVGRLYETNALPSSFFIDKKGVIRKVVYGGPIAKSLLIAETSKLQAEP